MEDDQKRGLKRGCGGAEEVAECMARMYAGGLTTSSGGNVSAVDAAGTLWITPRGTDKGALAAADVVALRPPWDASDAAVGAPHAPSTELPLHRRIYGARRDVRAVLHAHPPALVACALAGAVPHSRLLAAAAARCGRLRCVPYAMPGTDTLAQLVCNAFCEVDDESDDDVDDGNKDKNNGTTTNEYDLESAYFVLMGHHGVVGGGATLAGLLAGLEALEVAATVLVHAHQLAALCGSSSMSMSTPAEGCPPLPSGRCYARAVRRALAQTACTRVDERGKDAGPEFVERCRGAAAQLAAFARRLQQQRLALTNAQCALSVRLDARHALCTDNATPLCALGDTHALIVLNVDTLQWYPWYDVGSNSNHSSSDISKATASVKSSPQPHWRCSTVHAAVYRKHTGVGAVVSSEGVAGVLAFAAAKRLCARAPTFAPAAVPEGLLALRRVAEIDGAAALADPARVAEAIDPRTAPVCVAAHDCVHAVGSDLTQACDRLEVAETLARSHCLCASLGAVPSSLPPEDVAALEKAFPLK